jgi:hypothetical protein
MGLDEAIQATVEKAISSGEVIRVTHVAEQLAAAHPTCGLAPSEIAERLFEAGVAARVPLEWGDRRLYGG